MQRAFEVLRHGFADGGHVERGGELVAVERVEPLGFVDGFRGAGVHDAGFSELERPVRGVVGAFEQFGLSGGLREDQFNVVGCAEAEVSGFHMHECAGGRCGFLLDLDEGLAGYAGEGEGFVVFEAVDGGIVAAAGAAPRAKLIGEGCNKLMQVHALNLPGEVSAGYEDVVARHYYLPSCASDIEQARRYRAFKFPVRRSVIANIFRTWPRTFQPNLGSGGWSCRYSGCENQCSDERPTLWRAGGWFGCRN